MPPGAAAHAGWHELSSKDVLARRVADATVALDAVAGPEPMDLRSLPRPDASWQDALVDAHVPARVAWRSGLGYSGVDAEVLARSPNGRCARSTIWGKRSSTCPRCTSANRSTIG